MFQIKLRLLGQNSGTNKKTGNPYRMVMVRTEDDTVFNLRADASCPDLAGFLDKDVIAKCKLGAYQMNPNVSLMSVEIEGKKS